MYIPRLIVILFFVTIFSSYKLQATAQPRELFVSLSGSDSNAGTRNKPLRSIQKAVDKLGPGKTVTLLEGQYDLAAPITISMKGSAENWITIRGEKGAKVILDGLKINIPDSGIYPRNNGLVQVENAAYVRLGQHSCSQLAPFGH